VTKKAARPRPPRVHRVDAYARQVLEGAIVAGPYVRLACERHERDRAEAKRKAFRFSTNAADHAIEFIERWCRLPGTSDDTGQARAFHLEPWQTFIVGSLFGWQWTRGHRRFRNAFIEVGKGNGKTPLLAAIGLYGLMADGQKAPEIYAAAAARDQAMIMFRDAVRMVEASPELDKRIKKSGLEHVYNMAYGLGFFRPFSREQGARSGTRPHMGLIDEVHEHPNAEACAKIRAGAKGNEDALFAEITNSGFDRTSICWQHHEHSVRVLEQVVEDDRWFAYVCALDVGEDPLTDPACHIKTNPNLGVSIQQPYLDDQVATAQHIPAETNLVLRLNFCVWTTAHTPAWDMAKWREAPPLPPASALLGRPCFGGLDLGQNDDFAAFALLWDLADGTLACRLRFWLPKVALTKYAHRPYAEWQRAGLLEVTDGDTTDVDLIEEAVIGDCRAAGVREVGYDKRFAQQLALHLQGAGLTAVDTPQGFGLNESIKSLAKVITDQQLRHGDHKILTWMMDNTVLRTGRNQELRLDKESAREKIDGVAALVMANARRIVTKPPPQYQLMVFGPP
jgi:phage terminase large subunit-like protein